MTTNPLSVRTILNRQDKGLYQVATTGAISGNIDVTPTLGDKELKHMRIVATGATAETTLKIYKDSVVAGNLLFDGNIENRDADNAIHFSNPVIATTKWIVVIGAGSGNALILAGHN